LCGEILDSRTWHDTLLARPSLRAIVAMWINAGPRDSNTYDGRIMPDLPARPRIASHASDHL